MKDSRTLRLKQFEIETDKEKHVLVALAGNPNVGKSTLFNALTGLRQHTGNWPGKTVTRAHGEFVIKGTPYLIVDLPGTYSLLSFSADEQVARDFICFGNPDVTLIVLDATSLERNLNLALQVTEITPKAIACVNLLDEAKRKGIRIDLTKLEQLLGIPVVGMSARSAQGIGELKEKLSAVAEGKIIPQPKPVKYDASIEAAIAGLEPQVRQLLSPLPINSRWVTLRLIEGDLSVLDSLEAYFDHEYTTLKTKEVTGHESVHCQS